MRTRSSTSFHSAFRRSPLVIAVAGALASPLAYAACSPAVVTAGTCVTTTASSGVGSLNQAVLNANGLCATNNAPRIEFDLPPSGPFVIAPSSPLAFQCFNPAGYSPTVDGGTQSFPYGGGPVVIEGTGMPYGGDGVVLQDFFGYGGTLTVNAIEARFFSYPGASAIKGNSVTVTGSNVHHNYNGVHAGASGTGTSSISSGQLSNNSYGVYAGNGTTVSGNRMEFNSYGVYASGLASGTVTVNQNEIVCGQYGIYSSSSYTIGVSINSIGVYNDGTPCGNQTGIYFSGGAKGTIAGNTISDNASNGIYINGDPGSTITGNSIGTNTAGTAGVGNGEYGIYLDFSYGTTITDNTISGNNYGGIYLSDDGYLGGSSTIGGNRIGTDIGKNTAIPNGSGVELYYPTGTSVTSNVISGNVLDGINIYNGNSVTVDGNTIGTNGAGTAALGNECGICVDNSLGITISHNLVSGNNMGIEVSQTHGLALTGNTVGLNASKDQAIGNGYGGIFASCGSDTHLQDNWVSGNGSTGVTLVSVDAFYNPGIPKSGRGSARKAAAAPGPSITGNNIGTGVGAIALPNGGHGLFLDYNSGCSNGATSSGHGIVGNVIAYNSVVGIELASGVGNLMSANSIYANGAKNVDINNNFAYGAPLPNDSGDFDMGPNGQQNYPTIGAVVQSGGNTTVSLSLDSLANTTFKLEVFQNQSGDLPGGRVYLTPQGTDQVTTGPYGGVVTHTMSFAGLHDYLSATATVVPPVGASPYGNDNDTSEFSPIQTVTAAPGAQLSPATLAFGSVTVGQTSSPQTATYSSVGTGTLTLNTLDSSAACTGGAICVGGDFTCTTTCNPTPRTLAPTTSCTLTANFHPNTTGAATGTIYFCSDAPTSPHFLTLTGTGTAPLVPGVSLSATTMSFGTVTVGSTAGPQSTTLTSTGNTPYVISALSGTNSCGSPTPICSGSDFSCTATCGPTPYSMSPGSSCNISASYSPTSASGASTTIFVCDNASGSPRTITLSGQGQNPPPPPPVPAVTLSSSTMNFGTVQVGSQSASQSVTLTSSGTGNYDIAALSGNNNCAAPTPICVGSDFSCQTTCSVPSSLTPGTSCSISAKYIPSVAAAASTTVFVCDNATGSPRSIVLSGTGSSPPPPPPPPPPATPLIISPVSYDFGGVPVGVQSGGQQFLVNNPSSGNITIAGVSISGDFSVVAGGCSGVTLSPSSSCSMTATFLPTSGGPASGQLTVTASNPAQSTSASVTGTGVTQAQLSLPESISMGSFTLGGAALSLPVTLTNTGNAPLTFSTVAIAPSPPFALANGCPQTLAAGANCTLTLTFSTTGAIGPYSGTLTIVSSAAGGSRAIPVTAIVQPVPAPLLRVAPGSISFGGRMVTTTSESQDIVIRNDGGAAANGLNVTSTSPEFIVTGCATPTLAPLSSCTASVRFTPQPTGGFGPRSASVSITYTGGSTPLTVNVDGSACRPFAARGRDLCKE